MIAAHDPALNQRPEPIANSRRRRLRLNQGPRNAELPIRCYHRLGRDSFIMVVVPGKRITRSGERLHQRLYSVCILIEMLARATHHLWGRHAKFNPGDRFAFGCTSLTLVVELPICGPLEHALHNKEPSEIHYLIKEREHQPAAPTGEPPVFGKRDSLLQMV